MAARFESFARPPHSLGVELRARAVIEDAGRHAVDRHPNPSRLAAARRIVTRNAEWRRQAWRRLAVLSHPSLKVW